MSQTSGLTTFACAAVLGLACVAPGAPAAGAQNVSPEHESLVKDLSATEYNLRQQANASLMADASFELPEIETLLADRDLHPEARQRLFDLGWNRFRQGPRAGLGVQFDDSLPHRVIIRRTYAPFPAEKILQPGDLIVEADGERIHDFTAFQQMRSIIMSRRPGETVPVVLMRGAERMEVDLPLGDFTELPNGRYSDDELLRAWHHRIRACRDESEPIASDLDQEAWAADEQTYRRVQAGRMKVQGLQASLVAGGEPRGGEVTYAEMRDRINRLGKENAGLDMRAINGFNVMAAPIQRRNGTLTFEDEQSTILEMIEAFRARIMQAEQQLREGAINAQTLDEIVREAAENIVYYRKVLEALEADHQAQQATPPVSGVETETGG